MEDMGLDCKRFWPLVPGSPFSRGYLPQILDIFMFQTAWQHVISEASTFSSIALWREWPRGRKVLQAVLAPPAMFTSGRDAREWHGARDHFGDRRHLVDVLRVYVKVCGWSRPEWLLDSCSVL